jgi:TetR/AcrR family transcriptional regulator
MISANVTTRSENKVTRLRVADAAEGARRKTSRKKSPRRGKAKRRRAQQHEQQRTVRTKALILEAALVEFAEKGFEGASIRDIGSRSGVPYPLITYHYRTKDMLWRAVAQNAHAQLRQRWESVQSEMAQLTPLERLRAEARAFLRFTLEHPRFHHFMVRESRPASPHLPWMVKTILQPAMQRLLPDIIAAQAAGDIPQCHPVLVHYLMIGALSVLSSLGDEIEQVSGVSTRDPAVIESYSKVVDELLFGKARRYRTKSRGRSA